MTDDRCSKLTRAAFLMIKGSTADDITSKEELLEALQFAGLFQLRKWFKKINRILGLKY